MMETSSGTILIRQGLETYVWHVRISAQVVISNCLTYIFKIESYKKQYRKE